MPGKPRYRWSLPLPPDDRSLLLVFPRLCTSSSPLLYWSHFPLTVHLYQKGDWETRRPSRCLLNQCWSVCWMETLSCESLAHTPYPQGVYRLTSKWAHSHKRQKYSKLDQPLSCDLREEVASEERFTQRKGREMAWHRMFQVLSTHYFMQSLQSHWMAQVWFVIRTLGPMCFGIQTFLDFREIILQALIMYLIVWSCTS